MYLFFILKFMFLEFNVEHLQVLKCLQIRNKHSYDCLQYSLQKTHIATNIIFKEGYIIGFNLLNGVNMTLWVKDLQYIAYTNMAKYDTISQVMLPICVSCQLSP